MTELFHVQVQKLFTINLPMFHKISHQQTRYFFRISCNLVLMYLRCFLFSWSNPEVEAIEGGSIQLACSSHTCLETKVSVCSSQTVMVPQSWTGWKQSHLSKLAAQSLQTPKLTKRINFYFPLLQKYQAGKNALTWNPKLLIHKKRKGGSFKEPWKNLEVICKLLFCCPPLNKPDIHCSPFFILHPKLPWMCWY